jgi:O-methyltransferase
MEGAIKESNLLIDYIVKNNIIGDFIECGVDTGRIPYSWINIFKKYNINPDIYLYDTFAGLTKPSVHDYTCQETTIFKMSADDVLKTWNENKINDKINKWCYTPLEKVKSYLSSTGYPSNKLHYIVGDVMETLKDKIPEKIALLRLDTDWYESTKFEMEQLYDNVVIGGVVIFDDYYLWNGQRKAIDDFLLERNITAEIISINNQTAYIVKK